MKIVEKKKEQLFRFGIKKKNSKYMNYYQEVERCDNVGAFLDIVT